MAARLKAGGFTEAELQVLVPDGAPKKGNLVVRLKGTGTKKPLLLLAHLDVVEARRYGVSRWLYPFRDIGASANNSGICAIRRKFHMEQAGDSMI